MIIIGPGISVGGGIGVNSGAGASPGGGGGGGSMRALLSASGQAAYDAAATDNFFAVSQADYAAVAAGLSSVTKYVMSDALVAENGTAWSGTFAQAYPSTISPVPSGVYLFGFISRTSTSGTSTPLISTTFRGTYTAISNSPTTPSGGVRGYFLRKASTATSATSYLGLVNSTNGLLGTTQFNTLAGVPTEQQGGYDNTVPYSTWVTWSGAYQIFQMLGTPTQQW
jgi:hypothetical protein